MWRVSGAGMTAINENYTTGGLPHKFFWIVHLHDADVGFLAMSRASNVVKVNQLFILPEYQGREIGSACMPRIVDEARLTRKSVILQVLKVNPRCLRFYQRLGFTIVGDSATHYQMKSPWNSTGSSET